MMTTVTYMVLGLVAYGAIVVATTLLAQPFRVKLVDLCEEVLAEPRWSADDREDIEWMLASATSGSIGLIIPLAALLGLGQQLVGAPSVSRRKRSNRIEDDPRYDDIGAYYMLSIMACSPVATLLSLPLMIATVGVAALRGDRRLRRVAERPVMAASAQMRPC